MAEPEPGVRANQGTPEQLPKGEAQRLNEETNVEAPEPIILPEEEPVDLGLAGPGDFEPVFEPETEDEEFITGPSTRPDEPQYIGSAQSTPISPQVRRMLPVLERAANDPEASQSLKDMVRYILRNS